MNDLKDKNIIVTGATGGIGNSIVKKFYEYGANILASGTKIDKLEKLKSLIVVLLSVVLFVLSTYEVWGNLDFEKGEINIDNQEESLLKLDTLGRGISDIADQKDTVDVFAV